MPRFQLSIHCEDLKPHWFFWSPSTYAQMTVTGGPQQGKNLGKTETVWQQRNPDYCKTLFVDTNPSTYMPIEVTIFRDGGVGRDDTPWLTVSFEATDVYQSDGHEQMKQVGRSKIYMSMDISQKGTAVGKATIQLRGLDIKNVEPGLLGLGRSDPFFVLFKKNTDPSLGYVRWNTVYRSEVIHNHLNPYWKPFTMTLEELCFADLECPLRVAVYDHDDNFRHTHIGQFETTIQKMQSFVSIRGNADRERAFRLFKSKDNDDAPSSVADVRNRGLIVVLEATVNLENENE